MKYLLSSAIALLFVGLSPLKAAEIASPEPIRVEAAEKLINERIQLLDVRTIEEWNSGHLKGARRVELTDKEFDAKVNATFDPAKPVLVYCRSGGRSARAVARLRELGFKNVHDLNGGITAWEKAGKPIVKPEPEK